VRPGRRRPPRRQVELECSWRQPAEAIDALLGRRIDGKAVLHID
jgi:hypothetical protein